MRIIAGTSGGIPIKVPNDTTRPTTDRVRESIFSSLSGALEGAMVLDLYAGSGSLGLESLSRGAQSALFVDENRNACQTIEQNLSKTHLSDKGSIRHLKVEQFLRNISPNLTFDLIFADPPYAKNLLLSNELIAFLGHENLPAALNPGGILILETFSRNSLPELPNWTMTREKNYGESRISFLTPKPTKV